jgi:hypothetical protein
MSVRTHAGAYVRDAAPCHTATDLLTIGDKMRNGRLCWHRLWNR